MRGTLGLFASVKPVQRYLQAGAPTGLTGLRTNPSPRSTLLYLYHRTLDKLADVPETSLYRQSVEAVTKHRMGLVQSVKPDGYDDWAAHARTVIQQHPDAFTQLEHNLPADLAEAARSFVHVTPKYMPAQTWSYLEGLSLEGKPYYLRQEFIEPGDERVEDAFDIERMETTSGEIEGEPITEGEIKKIEEALAKAAKQDKKRVEPDVSFLKQEPILTASQIEELENKIGAGLIEEVIQVAEGELHLVDTIKSSQVWESLEEKPQQGQWVYFERKE